MRTIKARELTVEAFAPYGSFINTLAPTGNNFGGFYPDQVVLPLINTTTVAFSPMLVPKAQEMIITRSEYHTSASEILLFLDDDAVFHVAPPSKGEVVPDKTEAFLVPRGTLLKLNTAVWHLAPFPLHNDVLHTLVALPERIYFNDCVICDFEEKDYIKVEL